MCIGMANGGKQVANDGKTMLLQRAIESAKNRVYYIDVNSMGDISYHHHKKAENQKELMNITVEALEKQIPKKPVNKTKCDNFTAKHYENCNIVVCPLCNGRLKLKSKGRHCDKCGQALDWSDTDEQNDR